MGDLILSVRYTQGQGCGAKYRGREPNCLVSSSNWKQELLERAKSWGFSYWKIFRSTSLKSSENDPLEYRDTLFLDKKWPMRLLIYV